MKKTILRLGVMGIALVGAFFMAPRTVLASDCEATVSINYGKDRFCLFGGTKCVRYVAKIKCGTK